MDLNEALYHMQNEHQSGSGLSVFIDPTRLRRIGT